MRKIFLLFTLALLTVSAQAQFEHPDLKSGKRHVSSMLLMPLQVEITKVSMKGPEPMIEQSREVETSLAPVIGEVIHNLGCTVDDTSVTVKTMKEDPDLKYAVDDLQKQFDATTSEMVRKSKDVRKGRFSLGDNVAKLPQGEKVDALVFVRASGQVLTGGKKAFGMLIGGAAFDMVQILIGVVDAKNGDVLYFSKPVMLKNLAKDPADTKKGMEKSFKNFMKANGTSVAEKKEEKPQPGN